MVCRQEIRQQQRTYGLHKRHSVQMVTTLSTNCNWWYCIRTGKATFPYWKLLLYRATVFKQLLLKNCAVDFVEICNVCTRKVIINAAKRIFNSDKICCSYYDFYFGVIFWNTLYKRMYLHSQSMYWNVAIYRRTGNDCVTLQASERATTTSR